MLSHQIAKIAADTCVDVATPEGDVGCVDFISTRKGVQGAYIAVGNPLGESGWWPLSKLELCGETAKIVVARYL